MNKNLKEESSSKCFSGYQKIYSFFSEQLQCNTTFGIYLPGCLFETNNYQKLPVLYFLSGLTCTHENFIIKSGFQRYANENKLIVVNPDTSPRKCNIEGEDDSWYFGTGAGFYIDATTERYKKNYRMYSYIIKDLIPLIENSFEKFVIKDVRAISGHSMGGHGALVISMKNPNLFKCVTAFSPISNPVESFWGKNAFSGYLGEDKNTWLEYDATNLISKYNGPDLHIRIDQGSVDPYFKDELLVDNFINAVKKANKHVIYNLHDGYDHSYHFVSTFIKDNFAYIAKFLHK